MRAPVLLSVLRENCGRKSRSCPLRLDKHLSEHGIEWIFNPPYASHHGGVWERQIRSVRRVLAGLTSEQRLSDENLQTLLCITESIVNNRPLTTVSTDVNDLEPLTPNHFLILRPAESTPGNFDQSNLRKKWRQIEYLSNIFWRRWVKEYLPLLQRRTKWLTATRDLQEGDIVMLVDYTLPRNQWLLGRVLEALKSGDGKVRAVKVKTKNAITKVCLLETVEVNNSKDIRANQPQAEE